MDAPRRPWEVLLRVEGWKSGYESVDRLLKHLRRKTQSEGSRATYLKTLAQFVRFTDLSPDDMVSLGKSEVEEKVQDFCDLAKAPRTANRKVEELKTFFRCNGFRTGSKCNLVLERRYVGARQRSRLEYIPTDEEIYRMINEAGLNLKWRAFLLTLYTTGMRNSTVRALRYGDIREELEAGIVPLLVRIYPEMKKIVPEACKNKIPYFVFMPKEAVEAVEAYLEEREVRLGPLEDGQILFCSDNRQIPKEKRPSTPLNMTSPEKIVKKAAKSAKIGEWQHLTPHCLRKAFERAVRNSGLGTKDQEFFMGHILPGAQDTYYDKTKIEDMRTKYAHIAFFPYRTMDLEKAKIESLLAFAKLQGFPEEKITTIREAVMKSEMPTADKVIEMLSASADLSSSFFVKKPTDENKTTLPPPGNNEKPYRSKIVSEKEIVSYVEDGWEILRELRNGKFLIKKPNQIASR